MVNNCSQRWILHCCVNGRCERRPSSCGGASLSSAEREWGEVDFTFSWPQFSCNRHILKAGVNPWSHREEQINIENLWHKIQDWEHGSWLIWISVFICLFLLSPLPHPFPPLKLNQRGHLNNGWWLNTVVKSHLSLSFCVSAEGASRALLCLPCW